MTETWGGIEAGGTHFVCAVGSGPDRLEAETSFPTTTPGRRWRARSDSCARTPAPA